MPQLPTFHESNHHDEINTTRSNNPKNFERHVCEACNKFFIIKENSLQKVIDHKRDI